MITRRSLVGMATLTVSAAAIGAAPEKAERKILSDHDQIAAAIQSFVKAYNDGDLQNLMSHYAEDLVKSRQGGVTETKKDAGARIFLVFQNFTGEDVVQAGNAILLQHLKHTLKNW